MTNQVFSIHPRKKNRQMVAAGLIEPAKRQKFVADKNPALQGHWEVVEAVEIVEAA